MTRLATQEDIDAVVAELKDNKIVRFTINDALAEARNENTDPVVIILGLFALGVLYGRGLLTPQRKGDNDAPR